MVRGGIELLLNPDPASRAGLPQYHQSRDATVNLTTFFPSPNPAIHAVIMAGDAGLVGSLVDRLATRVGSVFSSQRSSLAHDKRGDIWLIFEFM